MGLLVGLFFPIGGGGYWYAVGFCLLIGAVFGLAAGLVGYALSGGKRDFTSTARWRPAATTSTSTPTTPTRRRRCCGGCE